MFDPPLDTVPPLLADFGAGRDDLAAGAGLDLEAGAGLDFRPTFFAGTDAAAAFFLASRTFFLGRIFFLGVGVATIFLKGLAFLAGVAGVTFLGFLA